MYHGLRVVQISNSGLEAFQSRNVCIDGPLCGVPSPAWSAAVRNIADEKADWTPMARVARCAVCAWGWYLCGRFIVGPQQDR
jgi:hypothetical protein